MPALEHLAPGLVSDLGALTTSPKVCYLEPQPMGHPWKTGHRLPWVCPRHRSGAVGKEDALGREGFQSCRGHGRLGAPELE